jgi:alpha-mannosidase
LAEAETWATFALGLGYPYPGRALDKAWRQLVFNSHHDGITGSESDQVYLDLLGGWREAFELAKGAKDRALAQLSSLMVGHTTSGDGATVVVFNRMAHARSGLVRAQVPVVGDRAGERVTVISPSGHDVACLATGPGAVEFMATDVPALGWRCYRVVHGPGEPERWVPLPLAEISNEHWRVRADRAQGGCLCSVVERATGRELLAPGELANELVVYEEYPTHPKMSEGPWHLMPRREQARSSQSTAVVLAERSCLGERLVISGEVAGTGFTQVVTLLAGQRRVELSTLLHGYRGADRLVRLRFGFCQQGATPLAETG